MLVWPGGFDPLVCLDANPISVLSSTVERSPGADLGSCWEVPSGCLLAGDTVVQVWQFLRGVLRPWLSLIG